MLSVQALLETMVLDWFVVTTKNSLEATAPVSVNVSMQYLQARALGKRDMRTPIPTVLSYARRSVVLGQTTELLTTRVDSMSYLGEVSRTAALASIWFLQQYRMQDGRRLSISDWYNQAGPGSAFRDDRRTLAIRVGDSVMPSIPFRQPIWVSHVLIVDCRGLTFSGLFETHSMHSSRD